MAIPTLYHGTIRVNAASILRGVAPRIGPTVARAYGHEHRALFFATDRPLHAAEYIIMAIEEAKPHPWTTTPLPWDELEDQGAIAVFEHPDRSVWRHCSELDYESGQCPPSVEPSDWFTDISVKPTRVLTGKRLMAFLKRHGFRQPSTREDELLRQNRA